MKKRLLSALLALALVFVLLPTTALADTTPVTDENVKINGTAVIVGNNISLGEGNGTYSYDKATHTLTLNSATINATGSIGISFGVPVKGNIDYKIELIGTNTISSTSAQAIYVEYDSGLDQQGTQKLSTLTINGSAGSQLILNASGYEKEAIWSKGDFTLSGGTAVTAFSSGKIAVNVGSMTINNSKLSAQSSSYGTTVVLYGLKMIGDTAEFEALNTSSVVSAVLGTSGASENTDWSNYQFTTGSYSGGVLTKSDPEVCSRETLNKYLGLSQKEKSQYIHIAKRTIPALQRTPDVLIAGENAVVSVETSIPSANGSGTYFYDQASKTLTLNNVNITKGINAIQFMAKGAYTIKLEGENKISNVSNGISLSDDQYITSLNVTITGTGSLDISAKGLAINMKKGDLKFENTGAIKLATSSIGLNNNALSVKGNITITDMSKYSVTGTQQTGGKPLGSEVSLTEASQLKGGTTGYRIITITPAALEKSNVYVAGTNLYKNTAYTIQNGKPVMGGTYPSNYNIYFDATDYVLHVKDATNIDARGTTGIYGTSNIVFEGKNSITASTYGIYSYFKSSDLKISGTGSLEVKTIAGDPAIATAYDTSRSIIISGNDFTVTADTSGTTSYAIKSDKDLTITGGAAVTAKSNATRAIDIKGDLTVTNGSLKATSTSDSVPTVQVGGNASFTGSSVTITNNSTTQGKQYEDSNAASSALHVNGAVTISGGTVTAEAKAGGNAIRAVGNITVSNDATVTAKNNSQYFNAITAGSATGGEVNTLYNLIVSGENTRITATNAHDNKLAYGGAINAYIENANEGHYLKANTDSKAIAPNDSTTVKSNDLTITRGDEVTRTNSPVVIDGHTLLNDTYYTINGSTVAEGTDSNYNAFYDSATKTLKLNNASINGAGTNKAIEANVGGNTLTIELVGNNIVKTSGFANNVIDITGNLYFTGSGTAEISGKGTPIYATYKIDVSADVTITNTEKAGSFTFSPYGENYKGANTFAIGAGYTAYATTDKTTWAVYDNTTASENESYTTLRITTQPPETGGGSTHEHVFSTSWESNADYHWHKCTVQGCTEVSDKEAHVYTNTWWKNSNGNHGRTCDKCRHEGEIHEFIKYYDFADETYHVERCGYLNCTYVGRQETHSYDSFGTCKCGYNPNGLPAPPSLQGVAPTSENGTDGKILNSNIGMEYAQNLNGPWTKWNEHSNITGLSAGTYYVRYTKTDERFPDNQVATVEVPAYTPGGDPTPDVPAAPTGLAGVAPTSANSKDGKITGTTAAMEYATSLEGDWTACANGSTDVPAGKYYVRMKKTDNTPAGEAVEVTVPAYSGTGEIVPPTPDNPGTIVIIRPAEEEKPAQQPNPSTGANDLVGLAVAAAVAAALGSAALLRKHD